MEIRLATEADIKKIKHWYANPVVFFLSDQDLKYPFEESDWIEIWFSGSDRQLYVLEIEGQIIASVSSKLTNDAAELTHIYVEKSFRRKGYARELINYVIDLNQSSGYQVKLSVLQREQIQLIESLGFSDSGNRFEHEFDGNSYQFSLYHRSHK